MLRKFVQTAIVGAAVLGLVGTASAYDREINLYGASAQHTFWTAAVPVWLATPVVQGGLACTTVTNSYDVFPKPVYAISVGTGCTIPGLPGSNSSIAVRYTSSNSAKGVGAACNMTKYTDSGCATGEVKMCDDTGKCATADRTCKNVHLGASDVQYTSFTQKTQPIGSDTGGATCRVLVFPSDEFVGSPGFCGSVLDYNESSVVVPFGFIANNKITKTRCTAPGPSGPNGEDKAYPHWGWECVPQQGFTDGRSADCVGYYKCLTAPDNEKRCGGTTATQAGTRLGQVCTKTQECQDVIYDTDYQLTKCEEMPIDNLSRLMVLLIFSGENKTKLSNWNQFGPWYPNLTLTRCLRCAGSGTHATFDLQVFRGDLSLQEGSVPNFFFNSGSTQMLTCVNDKAGGVGYIDADNIIGAVDQKVHIVRYEGVEPTREKVRNCEYNYWNPQQLYGINSELAANNLTDLVSKTGTQSLVRFASQASTLDLIGFPTNYFWGTDGEQKCKKSPNEAAYPTLK